MSLQDVRVLIVDDSDFSAQLIKSLLHVMRIDTVFLRASAKEALSFLAAEPDKIDLAIIDWAMPETSGLDLLKAIRGADSPNRKLPVIMISGEPLKERVDQARKAGTHDFLVKPLSARRLENAIRHAISHARPFIISETYVGPDRRWRDSDPPGDERRHQKASALEPAEAPDAPSSEGSAVEA